MLEILRSKVMMGFAVLVLGIVFVNTTVTTKLEENEKVSQDNFIAMNVQ